MTESQKSRRPALLQGNEAMVEGALAAGCRFFAGYPITPATEISEAMSWRLPALGGTFIQMEDEIASMGAVIGASLAGVKAMTATSGPGFSLMQENLGFACIAEVPCVIVNVMRGGPSTGLPTHVAQGDVQQARWGTHGDHPIIVLAPATTRDCFEVTVQAFNLSEKYRTPVIILSDEIVAHTREINQHYFDINMVEEHLVEDAEVLVVAYGSVARSAKRAVGDARQRGVKAGLIKLITLWPFPWGNLLHRLRHVKRVLVPELNRGQIAREVKRIGKNLTRVETLNRIDGKLITPEEIAAGLVKI
jgi:pyruvate/2-oxoacid:ferredoxin oxidoreductase alpha subunit